MDEVYDYTIIKSNYNFKTVKFSCKKINVVSLTLFQVKIVYDVVCCSSCFVEALINYEWMGSQRSCERMKKETKSENKL